jgi:tetraacyldisaccharide 4'-kinase
MKAPVFWYQSSGLLAWLLQPLAWVYDLIGRLRRVATSPYRAPQKVICVGNIVAGGAGKTPVAIALAKLLQQSGQRPAFASRGYGGTASAPLRVDNTQHNSGVVGDEPLLLAKIAPTWVSKNKAAGVAAVTDASHIILDDGLQNPSIAHDLALLVIDGARGLGNGHIIPAGPLREPLDNVLARVQAVILIGADDHDVAQHIAGRVPVLRAHLQPVLPPDFNHAGNFVAFAGIGHPEKFFQTCRETGLHLSAAFAFPDHHPFSIGDWQQLMQTVEQHRGRLITTAKDAMRLPPDWREQVTILPVELVFDEATAIKKLLDV